MSATPIYQQRPAQRFTSFPWNRIVIYGCALFISCWSVGPFLWQMSTSLQLDKQLVSGNPTLLPDPITLDHFINIFVAKSFHRYLLNSVIVAGTTTFLCLLFGAIAAFALARLDIRGRFGILARDTVLEKLGGAFTALGMSYSELRALCVGSRDPISKAFELSESLNLSRLCVHADDWALAITKDEPRREFECPPVRLSARCYPSGKGPPLSTDWRARKSRVSQFELGESESIRRAVRYLLYFPIS